MYMGWSEHVRKNEPTLLYYVDGVKDKCSLHRHVTVIVLQGRLLDILEP